MCFGYIAVLEAKLILTLKAQMLLLFFKENNSTAKSFLASAFREMFFLFLIIIQKVLSC